MGLLLTLLILSSLSIRVRAHVWVEQISGVTVPPISAWATGGYSGFGWICGHDDIGIWGVYVN